VAPARIGRIILLNGVSSSGKSSIALALLPLLQDPWFLVSVDAISGMRSTVHARALEDDEVAEVLTRTRRGYHRAVAALASVGNDVIMDYPLSEQWRLIDLLDVLEGYDVTLVEVRCSPEEIDRRERARGDRPVGLASSQTTGLVRGEFDMVVDTTQDGPETCAMGIANGLDLLQTPKAFDRLRSDKRNGT
jgi:chloramphenicol 3-O phosphotransferase